MGKAAAAKQVKIHDAGADLVSQIESEIDMLNTELIEIDKQLVELNAKRNAATDRVRLLVGFKLKLKELDR